MTFEEFKVHRALGLINLDVWENQIRPQIYLKCRKYAWRIDHMFQRENGTPIFDLNAEYGAERGPRVYNEICDAIEKYWEECIWMPL